MSSKSYFILSFTDSLNNYNYPAATLKRDYTKTYYEQGYTLTSGLTSLFESGKQENLRNRIGAIEQRMAQYDENSGDVEIIEGTEVYLYTSYSYDFHGNVKGLVQTNTHLTEIEHQYKYMRYSYDLISGNVKEVAFQTDSADEWNHRYQYDANNRLVRAWTSDDHEEWEMDAKYFYYLHGSMARVETGHDKVQGTDYAYNLQGWLKGVNSTTLQTSRDLGGDAKTTDLDKYSGTDVYGFSLGYFDGDYTPISGTAFANTDALISANGANGNLYNGNITHMVTAMKDDNEAMLDVLGNIYKYDQLQRIKSMDVYSVATQATYISNNSFTGATVYSSGAYAESYSFDKNGNLDSLTRNDDTGTSMDDFSYVYDATKKNRLLSVDDAAGSGVSAVDVDDQAANNYGYNAIGQLISDTQENITNIEWTVTGKVRKVTQNDGANTEFFYDAMGNRVMKIEMGINEVDAVYTYYVCDASGNVMSTYSRTIVFDSWAGGDKILADEYKLTEKMIYGSRRIGVKNENRTLTERTFKIPGTEGSTFYHTILSEVSLIHYPENFEKEKRKVGEKYYEFSNHLGNVLEVTTDRKIRNTGETAYEADVISYQDFGPFGQSLSGRSGSTDIYKFSFQGQESDPEIKGEDNSINYKYRMHDPRIGRFFAVDPLSPKYPHYSPYSFSGNRVIDAIELEGLEPDILAPGIPNPVYEVDYNSEAGSQLAEGDPVMVGTNILVNHCGITLEDGSIYGAGLYKVIDYVEFAFTETNLSNTNELYSQNIPSMELKDHYNGLLYYEGIDRNSGLSPYINAFIEANTHYQGPSRPMGSTTDGMFELIDLVLLSHGVFTLGKNGIVTVMRLYSSSIVEKEAYVTVGRWMSTTEYELMNNGGAVIEGAGGKTSVTIGGPGVWPSAAKGSIYVEFDVPANSLVLGHNGIYTIVGPNASKMVQAALKKSGGQILPVFQNLSPPLLVK